jgi:steroid delta-isomerase-like uncharacterized protein
MTTPKALVHRWFEEVWNQQRQAAIYEMLHPDGVVHGLADSPGQVIRGPDGFLPFWQKFISAFPDLKVSVDAVIAEGDLTAFRCTVRGKHSGKGLGIEPTGAQVTFNGMAMARIENGKIIEAWNNFDFLSLQQQLGPRS